MTETRNAPARSRNLDQYGHAELPWSRARDLLTAGSGTMDLTFFVSTTRPDGRPHTAPVGAVWLDDSLWFAGGPGTRRSRNLATNPACTVSVRLPGLDLVFEGEARRVTSSGELEHVAAYYRRTGWPATVVEGAFTAPSAGPPPWHLYRLRPRTAFGVATAEPHGATRWDFP